MEVTSNQFLFNERIFLQSTTDIYRTEMFPSINYLCKEMTQGDICCVIEETSNSDSYDGTAHAVY